MPAFGGTAYWVRGPDGLDARALQAEGQQHGILIEPGDIFFHREDPPRNFFRLGFSSIPAERIGEGVRRLRRAIDGMGREKGAA